MNLTSPVNANIADAQGQGTILNDDGAVAPAAPVGATAPLGPTSSRSATPTSPKPAATFSRATASVDSGTVTLQFTGAVPSGFADGVAISVQGASVLVAGYEVDGSLLILFLPDGALHPGDLVKVTWPGDSVMVTAR